MVFRPSPEVEEPPRRAAGPVLHPLLRERDPEFIRAIFPVYAAVSDYYYRADVEGQEHLPPGPVLVAATHNGGFAIPDAVAIWVAYWRRFGTDAPGYAMTHKAALALPGVGLALRRMGGVPASPESAAIVLRAGFPLFTTPGGDLDSLKPFAMRHRVVFGGRRGFIRVAIRHQVPIVPVVSVGAHETQVVLNDGRWLARVTGFARFFRIKTLPVTLSFPFGLTLAGIPSIPLPTKVSIRILPPIDLGEPPLAADDPATVERCYERVRAAMQRELTDLASRRKRVFFG